MKEMISKLLQKFEAGDLNRRQLIESLALCASAMVASGQTGAPNAPAFKTIELDHIPYQVKDYRITRDFYADLMGMEVKNDNALNQCELHFGNSILLARNHFATGRSRPAQVSASPAGNGRGRAVTSLVDHISYRIQDWHTTEVTANLIRRKLLTNASQPDLNGGPNYASFHVEDPDGFNLQISGWAGSDDSIK